MEDIRDDTRHFEAYNKNKKPGSDHKDSLIILDQISSHIDHNNKNFMTVFSQRLPSILEGLSRYYKLFPTTSANRPDLAPFIDPDEGPVLNQYKDILKHIELAGAHAARRLDLQSQSSSVILKSIRKVIEQTLYSACGAESVPSNNLLSLESQIFH